MNLRLKLVFGLASLLPLAPFALAQTGSYGGQTAAPYGTQATAPYGSTSSSSTQSRSASQSSAGVDHGTASTATEGAVQSTGLDISSPPSFSATTDHALLYPAVHDYILQPGDLIDIHIFGETEFVPAVRIDSAGQASLPFLGDIHLAGLTATEAQTKLADALSQGGFYVAPQVTIGILEGSGAIADVTGDLHGIVPIFSSRRLIDVLAALGGLGPNSSHIITITRPGVSAPIVVDLGSDPFASPEANIPVLPGDIVNVSRAGVVFVVGEFKNPGIYPLSGSGAVTLMQLTALTGGPAKAAKIKDLRLVRTTNGKRQFVVLNIHDILLGRASDPILKPGDILYMPTSPIKDALTNGTVGSALSIASIVLLVAQLGRN